MATNKKEAFRQYLEAAGVLDTISKSVALSCTSLLLPSRLLLALAELASVYLQFWSACMKSLSDQRMLLSKLSTLFATVHRALSCVCVYFRVKLTMLSDFSYIKGLLGGPTPAEYDALKQEKEDLKQQLESTKKQLEDLQAKVCHRI